MNESTERKFYAVVILALIALVAVSILMPPRTSPVFVGGTATTQGKTLSVSGTGTISARPDEAWFFAAVVTQSLTATQALNDNAAAMTRVLDQMNQLGIAKDKIETVGFSLMPLYDYSGKTPSLVGYQVRNAIKITVSDLSKIGQVIDSAVNAGANEVQGVQFTLSERRAAELREQALQMAVQDASGKAQRLASLLGVTLAGPVTVNIGFSYEPIFVAAVKAEAAQTPIVPGQLQVTVTIQVVYAFN